MCPDHEVEEIAVAIQVLHVRVDHVRRFDGIAGFPGALDVRPVFRLRTRTRSSR